MMVMVVVVVMMMIHLHLTHMMSLLDQAIHPGSHLGLWTTMAVPARGAAWVRVAKPRVEARIAAAAIPNLAGTRHFVFSLEVARTEGCIAICFCIRQHRRTAIQHDVN